MLHGAAPTGETAGSCVAGDRSCGLRRRKRKAARLARAEEEHTMTIGPVQMLVLGFESPDFRGEVLAEIDRLRQSDTVRLVDALVMRKHEDGTVEKVRRSDLTQDESTELGATIGALIGFGAGGMEGAELGAEAGAEAGAQSNEILDEDVWYVEEAIPPGSAAAVVLLEHRWAIPLRESIRSAGGALLADAWIHPQDLVAVGLLAREEALAA